MNVVDTKKTIQFLFMNIFVMNQNWELFICKEHLWYELHFYTLRRITSKSTRMFCAQLRMFEVRIFRKVFLALVALCCLLITLMNIGRIYTWRFQLQRKDNIQPVLSRDVKHTESEYDKTSHGNPELVPQNTVVKLDKESGRRLKQQELELYGSQTAQLSFLTTDNKVSRKFYLHLWEKVKLSVCSFISPCKENGLWWSIVRHATSTPIKIQPQAGFEPRPNQHFPDGFVLFKIFLRFFLPITKWLSHPQYQNLKMLRRMQWPLYYV